MKAITEELLVNSENKVLVEFAKRLGVSPMQIIEQNRKSFK